MPNAPSDTSLKAEKLYREGKKLTEIAAELGVPAGTVRRWKHDHGWDGGKKKKEKRSDKKTAERSGKKGERSGKNKANVRKPGAPFGNHNGLGHGPPKGNRNAYKHGGYSEVYWDTLSATERAMLEELPTDEESLLIDQIYMFSVRERRLMQAIQKYRDMKDLNGNDIPVSISYTQRSEHKRVFDGSPEEAAEQERKYKELIEKKVEKEERMPGRDITVLTHTENKDDIILRLERELSTVQSKKTVAIQTLAKLRLEKQKMEGDSQGNDFVRTWAEAVLSARGNADG